MGNKDLNKNMGRHPLGTVEPIDDQRTALTFERVYTSPVADVWEALLRPEKTIAWLAESEGDLHVGGAFNLRWLNVAEENLEWWHGRIMQIEPPNLLVYTNSAHGLLRWELEATDDDGGAGCRLKFTNVVNTVGQAALMSAAGWHTHLDHLQECLVGRAVDWPHWRDDFFPAWEAVHAEYAREYA